MKLIRTAVAIAVSTGLVVAAFAAQPAATTATQQQKVAKLKQELTALSSKITKLKADKNLHTAYPNAIRVDSDVIKASKATDRGVNYSTDKQEGVLLDGFPGNTFALSILQHKKQFYNGEVLMGGVFEGDTQYWNGDQIATQNSATNIKQTSPMYQKGTGTYVTSLHFDFLANINSWVDSYVAFEAHGFGSSSIGFTPAKALVTIGNLAKCPLFVTVGKIYLPFGVFGGGGPWASSLDYLTLKPAEVNQISFGYDHDGVNTNFSILNRYKNNGPFNFVYSIYYNSKIKQANYGVGLGYLNDARTDGSGFSAAYSPSGDTNAILKTNRLALADLNAHINYKEFGLAGEYTWGLQDSIVNSLSHHATNITANQNLGRVSTWYLQSTYAPVIMHKKTTFMLSYSATKNMEGIPMGLAGNAAPGFNALNGLKHEWITSVTREFFPDVFLSLEYQRAETYTDNKTYAVTFDTTAYF